MTPPRVALVTLAATFAIAEFARPTRFVAPKRSVAGGLVLRSQGAFGGTARTLDPELLDDLPRIHPDALGTLGIERDRRGGIVTLRGWIADPDARAAGIAVFPIVDGARIANARTTYGLLRPDLAARFGSRVVPSGYRIDVPVADVARGARLAVGLIATDRRGYFLLDPGAASVPPNEPSR